MMLNLTENQFGRIFMNRSNYIFFLKLIHRQVTKIRGRRVSYIFPSHFYRQSSNFVISFSLCWRLIINSSDEYIIGWCKIGNWYSYHHQSAQSSSTAFSIICLFSSTLKPSQFSVEKYFILKRKIHQRYTLNNQPTFAFCFNQN